jgi:hypothetical protein
MHDYSHIARHGVWTLSLELVCHSLAGGGFQGGHYFFHERASVKKSVDNRQGMKTVHSVGLENWLLRRAMAAKLLCIYDKQELSFGATCR